MKSESEEHKITESVQDYLKTIYKLQESEGTVSTTQIANELGFTGASVTGMLKRLAEIRDENDNPLVDYNSYKGVRLTSFGTRVALNVLRNHRLLELFLKESLGFSLAKVHTEADELEHYISEDFVEKIDSILGNPSYSPLGNPIPNKDGEVPKSSKLSLAVAELNRKYVVQRISDHNNEMIAYFEEKGFLPGLHLTPLSRAPFNGPISILYNGKEEIIGHEIAKNMFVDEIE
ncbi:metal-dependent transcriptional regulator [Candidatus Kapaibacterium sp.]